MNSDNAPVACCTRGHGVTKETAHLHSAACYRTAIYPWMVVGILLLAYVVSMVDRQILSLMVDPVRADLGISDTQISLLHGFAFAIFYTLFGALLGRAADRWNRRNL